MIKKTLSIAILTSLFLISCKETPKAESIETPKTENTEAPKTEAVEKPADETVTSSVTNKDGKKLDLSFDNTKNTATLNWNGEVIELDGQRVASGFWYKNDHYELRGKGEQMELTKDGETIFEN